MKIPQIIMMALCLMLFSNCTSEASSNSCIGTAITETTWLEYQYLCDTGELVPYSKEKFTLKMVGERPVVCNRNGYVAEKHIVVLEVIKTTDDEMVNYDCDDPKIVIYDGLRTSEEAKDYNYILSKWKQTIKYYTNE